MEMMDSSPSRASPRTPPAKHRRRADLTLTLSTAPSTPPPPAPADTFPPLLHHLSLLDALKPEERGIRLIQLLLACASHTASSNIGRADACLRLISALSSPTGDSMQRLAARLASSLAARILRHSWPGVLSAINRLPSPSSRGDPKAHRAFARSLPYLPFAHAVVGRTLLRVLAYERVVHLVDLGATHASLDLWAPVLRALARVPRGLRLTCVSPDPSVLEFLGSALAKEAETMDVPFQFHPVHSSLYELDPDALRVRTGEALAVVSILSLHELLADHHDGEEEEEEEVGLVKQQRSCGRIERFLSALRLESPKVVVLAEQEADHNSSRMVDRFAEVMHYYSTVFDSVESAAADGLLAEEERAAVEEMLGRQMVNVVACEGRDRVERHERVDRWMKRMARAGFRQVRVWSDAGEEGKRVVESWPAEGGYNVVMYRSCFTICWHDRPLYAVSAWQSTM